MNLDFILKLAGVPDDIIADLQQVSPPLANLVVVAKQLEPIINRKQTLAEHIEQVVPIVQGAWPDIMAVIPPGEALVTYINSVVVKAP